MPLERDKELKTAQDHARLSIQLAEHANAHSSNVLFHWDSVAATHEDPGSHQVFTIKTNPMGKLAAFPLLPNYPDSKCEDDDRTI